VKKFFLLLLLLLPCTALAAIEYRVDTNYGRDTRPMKSIETKKTIGRIAVGAKCAEFSYATFFGRYQYHIVINDLGVTGASVCVAIETENPYLQQVPGRIEFENYTAANDSTPESNRGELYRDAFGVDIENKTGDVDGANVGWIVAGESLTYDINVGALGYYLVRVRYAREDHKNPIDIAVFVDRVKVLNVGNELKPTGGWDVWDIYNVGGMLLAEGRHEIRIDIISGHVNLDWFDMIDDNGLITIRVMAIS